MPDVAQILKRQRPSVFGIFFAEAREQLHDTSSQKFVFGFVSQEPVPQFVYLTVPQFVYFYYKSQCPSTFIITTNI